MFRILHQVDGSVFATKLILFSISILLWLRVLQFTVWSDRALLMKLPNVTNRIHQQLHSVPSPLRKLKSRTGFELSYWRTLQESSQFDGYYSSSTYCHVSSVNSQYITPVSVLMPSWVLKWSLDFKKSKVLILLLQKLSSMVFVLMPLFS